jgi:hypothetical protein
VEIRFRVPKLPSGLAMNLVGLFGLIAMVLAVGGLTHNWWWSLLAGGAVAFGLAYVAQTQGETAATAPVRATDAARDALDEQTREVAYLRGKPATA